MIKSFRDLKVWEKAHNLVIEIYKKTTDYPNNELYGLVSQMRRASVSIPANIAEGSKRNTTKDLLHFLNIAQSSLEELKYYLILSRDLNYLSNSDYERLSKICEEVSIMLYGLVKSLRRKSKR